MAAKVRRGEMHHRSEAEVREQMTADGLTPRSWDNGAGDTYERHEHDYDKVLYCVQGSLTLHTDARNLLLAAGDRVDIEAGTPHAVTVGPEGVRCVEAPQPPA